MWTSGASGMRWVAVAIVAGIGFRIVRVVSIATRTRTLNVIRVSDMAHNTYRIQDTVYCRRCGKSWDVRDDAPATCESVARVKYLAALRRMGMK
jgi:hypothetical protein